MRPVIEAYRWRRLGLVALATMTAVCSSATASLPVASPTTLPAGRVAGTNEPYCGIYCVYGALRLLTGFSDMRSLVKPEYVGSSHGSSFEELAKAAVDNGLKAYAFKRLSVGELRRMPSPVVLHVAQESIKYNHFVLYLGPNNDGSLRLLDSADGLVDMSPAELAAYWDGHGLLLSRDAVNVQSLLWRSYLEYGFYYAVAIATFWWLRKTRRGKDKPLTITRRTVCSLLQVGGMSAVAVSLALVQHGISETGFFGNERATIRVIEDNLATFVENVGIADIPELKAQGAVFVDARFPGDYEAGHLDEAINIPLFLDRAQRSERLSSVGADRKIVVYCQSGGCDYARRVAVHLLKDGYAHVVIFKGGWNEWSETYKDKPVVGAREPLGPPMP